MFTKQLTKNKYSYNIEIRTKVLVWFKEEYAMKNRKKSYRIKSKFRFITSLTVTLIVFVFMAFNLLGLDNASSLTKENPIQIEIQSGDSLWNIACKYGPDHTDIRKIVYDICSLNDITAESIYPGQKILIPDYSK